MGKRVSPLVVGVFVLAMAVTGCGGSAGGADPTVKANAGGAASVPAPAPATATPALSPSPAPEPVATTEGAPVGYRLGGTGPGGGIVFYDAGSPQGWGQYLEAAPAGWSGGSRDPLLRWCDRRLPVATSTAIGTGAANTRAMLAACSSGAANRVRDYAGGGRADWFLPSKDELNQLFLQKAVVGGFAAVFYWTSSQDVDHDPWYQHFSDGSQGTYYYKYNSNHVRPVRAF